jgi:hypothetical protein
MICNFQARDQLVKWSGRGKIVEQFAKGSAVKAEMVRFITETSANPEVCRRHT